MFIQVIQGRVSDKDALRAQVDKWRANVAPGATGWLGSTAGVTADGRSVAVVRFESEDSARQNEKRPEQDAWWSETAALFDGDPTFAESGRGRRRARRRPKHGRVRAGHARPVERPQHELAKS